MASRPTSNWLVPVLLLALGALNIASGAFQLHLIGLGPPPDGAASDFTSMQYFATPIPIVLHIVSGILFNLMTPFQFAPDIRVRWPAWHRWSGRLLVLSGLLAALSGLWMNQFFPVFGSGLKYSAVLVFATGMVISLVLGLRAILRRDIRRHRAWMMRAIAIGLAPAVQRLILLPVFLVHGEISILVIELVVWLSFLLNLAVIEWSLIRARRGRSGQIDTNLTEAL